MKAITQIYKIKAPIQAVWKALTNAKSIDAWGGGPAKMNGRVGAKFTLWGGDIFGKNIEILRGKKLVQEWSTKSWKKPSLVTFILEGDDEKTEVRLVHEKVPTASYKSIAEGWKDHYMGPLKTYVEEYK